MTATQARAAARRRFATESAAQQEIRKSAASPSWKTFDIFLSHAYDDAEVIAGIKIMLETQNLSVYVDWMDDPQADRTAVTAATADMLRRRMANCRFLLFASSTASPKSRWMPWELGYFDGLHRGAIGILPIVQSPSDRFVGQEYLGLYPKYELVDFTTGKLLGRQVGLRKEALATTVRSTRA